MRKILVIYKIGREGGQMKALAVVISWVVLLPVAIWALVKFYRNEAEL